MTSCTLKYLKKILHEVENAALKEWDEIQRKAKSGKHLLHRVYDLNGEETDISKTNEIKYWYSQKGYISVISIDYTQGSVFQQRYHLR